MTAAMRLSLTVHGYHFHSLELAVLGTNTPQKLGNPTDRGFSPPHPAPLLVKDGRQGCAKKGSRRQSVRCRAGAPDKDKPEWRHACWASSSRSESLCPHPCLHHLRSLVSAQSANITSHPGLRLREPARTEPLLLDYALSEGRHRVTLGVPCLDLAAWHTPAARTSNTYAAQRRTCPTCLTTGRCSACQ